jgi:hypothetical protein
LKTKHSTNEESIMFNQNDARLIRERQRELQRAAKRHNMAQQARRSARQSRTDTRRWARVLSLFL